MKNYFLRPVEARVVASLMPRVASSLAMLSVRSGLSASELASILPTLERREFVHEVDEGEYQLTADGVLARRLVGNERLVVNLEQATPGTVFPLTDEVEAAAAELSDAELNAALDEAFGPLTEERTGEAEAT